MIPHQITRNKQNKILIPHTPNSYQHHNRHHRHTSSNHSLEMKIKFRFVNFVRDNNYFSISHVIYINIAGYIYIYILTRSGKTILDRTKDAGTA